MGEAPLWGPLDREADLGLVLSPEGTPLKKFFSLDPGNLRAAKCAGRQPDERVGRALRVQLPAVRARSARR